MRSHLSLKPLFGVNLKFNSFWNSVWSSLVCTFKIDCLSLRRSCMDFRMFCVIILSWVDWYKSVKTFSLLRCFWNFCMDWSLLLSVLSKCFFLFKDSASIEFFFFRRKWWWGWRSWSSLSHASSPWWLESSSWLWWLTLLNESTEELLDDSWITVLGFYGLRALSSCSLL